MTGYELDTLAVFVFFLLGFGLAGLVICWAVKEAALSGPAGAFEPKPTVLKRPI